MPCDACGMTDRVLVLAAGQSTRMRGRDKLLEVVDGRPLLRRQSVMAQSLGWPVHVALPPRPHARFKALEGLDLALMPIETAAEGMGGTLRGAVNALPEDTGSVLLLLADLPDITAEDLARVVAAGDAHPKALILRGATRSGKAGHPILFRPETRAAFSKLSGDDGGKAVVQQFADRLHLVPLPDDRALRDLDTPEDWEQWRAAQQQ